MEHTMSNKLALSSALSVLLMVSYVLFGGDARPIGFISDSGTFSGHAASQGDPQASSLFSR